MEKKCWQEISFDFSFKKLWVLKKVAFLRILLDFKVKTNLIYNDH